MRGMRMPWLQQTGAWHNGSLSDRQGIHLHANESSLHELHQKTENRSNAFEHGVDFNCGEWVRIVFTCCSTQKTADLLCMKIQFIFVGWKSISREDHTLFPACHPSCRSRTSPGTLAARDSHKMHSPARQACWITFFDRALQPQQSTCCARYTHVQDVQNVRHRQQCCGQICTHRQHCDPSFNSQSIAKGYIVFFAGFV